jgi:hypothetical protein
MGRVTSASVSAAIAIGVLLCAPAAFAARPSGARLAPLEGHLRRGFGASESTNWSGYAAYDATFTSAEGNWVQPSANCEAVSRHGYALAAFWVGLDGYEDVRIQGVAW